MSANSHIWIFGVDLYRLLFLSNMNHLFSWILLLLTFGHMLDIMNHKLKGIWIMLSPLMLTFYDWQISHCWTLLFLPGLDLFFMKALFIFKIKLHSRACPYSRAWSLCLRHHFSEVSTEWWNRSLHFGWAGTPINSSIVCPLELLFHSQPWEKTVFARPCEVSLCPACQSPHALLEPYQHSSFPQVTCFINAKCLISLVHQSLLQISKPSSC